jgi:hypothetical protein
MSLPPSAKEDIRQLSESIKEERVKDNIINVLSDFGRLPRRELLAKVPLLNRCLAEICQEAGANALLNLVSLGQPDLGPALSLVEDPDTRTWLKTLNMRFCPVYEGILPPWPDDWYRVSWRTSINIGDRTPLLHLTIMKRGGEVINIESPFQSMLRLFVFSMTQMEVATREGQIVGMDEQLKEIRKLADTLLERSNITSKGT